MKVKSDQERSRSRHRRLAHMHPTAIPSLIHHANDTDKDCAKMIYSQTPNEFGEEAVKHYKECTSYQAPRITRLLLTTYSNSDIASYQR
jgi:uncharacterized protein involved in tolerance to divalent cations